MIGKIFKWLSNKFEICSYDFDEELGFCFDIRFWVIYITISLGDFRNGWKARWNNLDKYFTFSFLTISFDF